MAAALTGHVEPAVDVQNNKMQIVQVPGGRQ